MGFAATFFFARILVLGWAVSLVARNDSNIFADYELWQIVSNQLTHAGAVAKPHTALFFPFQPPSPPRAPPTTTTTTTTTTPHTLPAAVRFGLDLSMDFSRGPLPDSCCHSPKPR